MSTDEPAVATTRSVAADDGYESEQATAVTVDATDFGTLPNQPTGHLGRPRSSFISSEFDDDEDEDEDVSDVCKETYRLSVLSPSSSSSGSSNISGSSNSSSNSQRRRASNTCSFIPDYSLSSTEESCSVPGNTNEISAELFFAVDGNPKCLSDASKR